MTRYLEDTQVGPLLNKVAVTDVYQTPEWKRAYMYALTIVETFS